MEKKTLAYDKLLRGIRSITGLSQAKFAEKFWIPVHTYEQWERGQRTPPAYVVKMIKLLLCCENEMGEDRFDYIVKTIDTRLELTDDIIKYMEGNYENE